MTRDDQHKNSNKLPNLKIQHKKINKNITMVGTCEYSNHEGYQEHTNK